MGIDVDAVINESQNSLSEPSVQFVTLSSVVGGISNSNIFRCHLPSLSDRVVDG